MLSKIQTPYGKVAIYRKTAPNATKTILVVPGFGESLTHNRELVDILANRG